VTDQAMPVPAPEPGVDKDTVGQIRGSSLLLVGRLTSIAITLLTQVLIVRHLSTTEFGAFSLAYAVAGMAQVVVTLGLHRGATRYVAMYDEQGAFPKLLGTILLYVAVVLGLGACCVLLVWLVPQAVTGTGLVDPAATGLLLILIFLAPIDALDDMVLNMFAVFAAPRAIFVRRYVLAPALRLIVAVVLVAANGNATQLAVGYVLASVLGVALYGALFVRLLQERGLLRELRQVRPEIPAREVLGFSIPLLSNDAVWLLINTVPLLLLTAFVGLEDVAAFQVVKPLAALNLLVSSNFVVLFLPVATRLVTRNNHDGLVELYWRTAIWIAVMTFPVFAATVAVAGPLTELLFGERYAASGTYLAIMSVGYYVNAALGFNAVTLSAAGRLRSVVSVNLATVVISLIAGLLLIAPLGALGAAISVCLTLLVQNALLQLQLRRRMGIPLLYRPAVETYAVIGVATAVVWILEEALGGPLVGIALVAIASLAVLALTHRALRIDDTFPEIRRLYLAFLHATRRIRHLRFTRSAG
jgi:O-antigen/teichoic acid export membrane protein